MTVNLMEAEQLSLDNVVQKIGEWANTTFSPGVERPWRVQSTIVHWRRELYELDNAARELKVALMTGASVERIAELHARVGDEVADCFHMLVHVAHQTQVSLGTEVAKKFVTNQARTWGAADAQGVIEHVER